MQKDEVFRTFQQLLTEYERNKLRVATREELAARIKDREVVQNASTYTTDAIVKGLTELQLNFSETIGKWSDTLQTESRKHEELRKAIAVETLRLKELNHVKTAAGALYLLKEEHQSTIDLFDKDFNEKTTALDESIGRIRETWEKEEQEFKLAAAEYAEKLQKDRQREQEEYEYSIERTRRLELDEYEAKKRLLEREFTEEDFKRGKNWKDREEMLIKQAADFEANKKKIDEFTAKLEEDTKKEREEAAREANREARVKAELLEKEEVANKQIGEHRIALLEKTMDNNALEIQKLTDQLNEALKKLQDLSARALEQ